MPNTLKLTLPTLKLERAALDMRKEFFDAGESTIAGSAGFHSATSYSMWMKRNLDSKTSPLPGYMPSITYFATLGDLPVGMLQIRLELNDNLLQTGGHIGYSVRPSMRNRGYATAMLALALERCSSMGIYNVLVTCKKDNIASAKVIIKNGGVFENEVEDEGGILFQRYWIRLV